MKTDTIIGPPGTGKTTTLSRMVCESVEAGRAVLVCSLTRAAAAEVAGRGLPIPKENVGTIHSHAFQCIGSPSMVMDKIPEFNSQYNAGLSTQSKDMDAIFANMGATDDDRLLQEADCLRGRKLPHDKWPPPVLDFYAKWTWFKKEHLLLDYTDLIQKCINECPYPPGEPDDLFVDEAQDLSALELDLLRIWAARIDRLVIVGDPHQALYVWRGAYPDMFREGAAQGDRTVLSKSYRIPRAVHSAATQWVSQLSRYEEQVYDPREYVGKAERIPLTYKNADFVVDKVIDHYRQGKSVMVATTCKYMLTPIIRALREAGVPFANPWKTKEWKWNPLGNKAGATMAVRLAALLRTNRKILGEGDFAFGEHWTDPYQEKARAWTMEELALWVSACKVSKLQLVPNAMAEIVARGKSESSLSRACVTEEQLRKWFKPEAWKDIGKLYHGHLDHAPIVRWYGNRVRQDASKLFDYPEMVLRKHGYAALSEDPRVFVGTIHSFKGAEADVVILFPDISYTASTRWFFGDCDDLIRSFYVGMTRAKEELYIGCGATDKCTHVQEYV